MARVLARGDLFRSFEPNAGHHALKRFMGRGHDDLVMTQNIDGLHRLAGHPEAQLVEIHGRHDRFICASGGGCEGIDHPVSFVDLSKVEQGVFPKCERCGAPMRPLVLLFDESYDSHPDFQAWRGKKALNDADVLVFVGTSFSVGITSYAVRCAAVSGATIRATWSSETWTPCPSTSTRSSSRRATSRRSGPGWGIEPNR